MGAGCRVAFSAIEICDGRSESTEVANAAKDAGRSGLSQDAGGPELRQDAGVSPFAEVLAQVDRLWHIGELVPTLDGLSARQRAVLAFKDGWATSRIDAALVAGIAASREEYPESWGRWQLNSKDELTVRWGSDDDFRDFYFAFSVPPASTTAGFSGCYSTTGFSDLSGIGEANVAVSVDTWCFAEDGRFTNDRTLGLNYSDSSAAASGQQQDDRGGTYSVDGYLITFVYSDGQVVRTLAGVSDDEPGERDLLLGGNHFNEVD